MAWVFKFYDMVYEKCIIGTEKYKIIKSIAFCWGGGGKNFAGCFKKGSTFPFLLIL